MTVPSFVFALAFAHSDGGFDWTLDPWVLGPLTIALAVFAVGYTRLSVRANQSPLSIKQAVLFIVGWCVLSGALVSPLHEAGERSFAAHMFEHELLMLVAAPMLIAARVQGVFLWALPRGARLTLARFFQTRAVGAAWAGLTDPVVATVLQAAALWLWHAPPLFDLALRSDAWHIAQHLSFLITALLFWSAMFNLHCRRTRPMTIVFSLFVTALVSGALGALMAFSQSPWYAGYRALELSAFGLTPTQDQQIAGLLMWIPGGLVHLGVALAVLAGVMRPGVGAKHPTLVLNAWSSGGRSNPASFSQHMEKDMGNQSQQSDADNRQQGFGGGQPEKDTGGKELREPRRPQPHQSGDRNANESMRDEGPERAPKR